MKKIALFILIAYLTLFFNLTTFGQGFEKNKIVIKFKDCEELRLIKSAKEIMVLKDLLGDYSVSEYISPNLLSFFNSRLLGNDNLNQINDTIDIRNRKSFGDKSIAPEVSNLLRIYVVEYSNNIDPREAVFKLSGLDFVEYTEAIPIKHIVAVPNDSLVYRQYYLNQIRVFDAWDEMEKLDINDSSVVIGIVDTGVDFEHEDLKDKIWQNFGEIGTDGEGGDKSSNGKDDDGNGFIDDWRGWDFVGSGNGQGDNDPRPGHIHGTHVAGIACATTNNIRGIAGISKGAKIMAVKVASDNPFNTSVMNSYEGILYAASMGADVINCSWGSESRSEAEMEILNAVARLGVLVVSAAGNDGKEVAFYPASHKDVVSVSSVDFKDKKSGFSNYHFSVDVAAPGDDIYSTVPGSEYEYLDGTSMASPVVAGICGLIRAKYPNYLPIQVKEHLKKSCDDIDTLNPFFVNRIGKGRVNAEKAVMGGGYKSVVVEDYRLIDENNDGLFELNENLDIELDLLNVLENLENGRVEIFYSGIYKPEFVAREIEFGQMWTMERRKLDEHLKMKLPMYAEIDYLMNLEIVFYDGEEFVGNEFISFVMNPSYRTMQSNNLAVTFNSRGNIGFNDYPANVQGEGFRYKNGSNLLYEGALMVGVPPGKVSNVARASNQMVQDRSFWTENALKIMKPGLIGAEEGECDFVSFESESEIAVEVKQKIYQFDDALNREIIYLVYDVINNTAKEVDSLVRNYDSLYLGLYFDWDIGVSGANNFAKFDDNLGFGYVRNKAIDSLPMVGITMLSGYKPNFFGIDNPATSLTNPGVWDGFERWEKWMMLSSGIYRKETSVTDVSLVIGAGPIKLNAGDTARVAFGIFVGNDIESLKAKCMTSRETAKSYGIADGNYNPLPTKNEIVKIYPNPLENGELKIDFALNEGGYISIDIYNSLGQKLSTAVKSKFFTAGLQTEVVKIPILASGRYYLKLTTRNGILFGSFEILR